jgi:hypothetical protein
VLSKCANPACLARFHYLHDGRIFKIDRVSRENAASTIRRTEYFWLCERCVQTLTVVVENGVVSTRPLHPELAEGVPQQESESKRHVA